MPFQLKTSYDENGRVCTSCNQYKERQFYCKMSNGIKRKSPNCLECRNIKKRLYREKTKYTKDREYKKRIRRMDLWINIILLWEEKKDLEVYWKIQKRKVLNYKFKKWYTIKSNITWYYRCISLGCNKNSVKYITDN